jgi:hypothetical protein
MVWKAWATPKVKFYSWLTIRNRIWTTDRLEIRGWDNCELFLFFKQTQESAARLFSHCRYSKRLWDMVKIWLCIDKIQTQDWTPAIEEWWTMMACSLKPNREAIASLTMLVSWTIWKERIARVFNNKDVPTTVLREIIKSEIRLWIAADA